MITNTAMVRVTVTLEVECSCSWGEDCSMKQIYDQAETNAIGTLNRLLQGSNGGDARLVQVRGTPKVEAVIAARGRQ